jgi:hypothetical protein
MILILWIFTSKIWYSSMYFQAQAILQVMTNHTYSKNKETKKLIKKIINMTSRTTHWPYFCGSGHYPMSNPFPSIPQNQCDQCNGPKAGVVFFTWTQPRHNLRPRWGQVSLHLVARGLEAMRREGASRICIPGYMNVHLSSVQIDAWLHAHDRVSEEVRDQHAFMYGLVADAWARLPSFFVS